MSNPNDIFWLARYAHNTVAPLIAEAQQYEKSISFKIELRFASADGSYPKTDAVNVLGFWERDRPLMFLHENGLTTKEAVDKVAAKVQEFINAEQAAIVVALPAPELAYAA